MAGQLESVRLLLAHGASARELDDMFFAPPLIWAVEGSTGSKHTGADFLAVVRLLTEADSSVEWNPPDSTPGREKVLEVLAELRLAASRTR
jgi:hypothetical protein